MLVRLTLAALLAAAPLIVAPVRQAPQPQAPQPQDPPPQEETHPKVPNDSLRATIEGCLKGRVIRAYDVRQPDTTNGIPIQNKSFRVEGKKDVIELVKKNDGMHVEIVGLIKKSALIEPGMKFKGGRVVVGGGTASAGMGASAPDPSENVVVVDAETLRPFGDSCTGK